MAFFDLPLNELREYRPDIPKPDDFDTFWERTLSETRSYALNPQFEPVNYGLKLVNVYDVTFAGYGGHPIKGWFVLPKNRDAALPCVVEYIGYGGGRGFGFEHLLWANMGYAYFLMDTRGQGSTWRNGDTPDIPGVSDPSIPGFMTQGIVDPETYYYKRVFADAVRAVEAARSHEAVDSGRIALTGASQGGGITLAAGALMPDVQIIMPDVPFLCHFQRAVTLVDTEPYSEIRRYLKTHRDRIETVYQTLTYFDFDGVNFAPKIQAKALFSVGLMDVICPPSTVFAAYNAMNTEKDIRIYDFNDHEGGGAYHVYEKMKFMQQIWG